jgi:hypothetical protein
MIKISIFFSVLYLFIITILYFLSLNEIVSFILLKTIIISASLNIVNLLCALAAFRFSVNKSNQEFLFYNLGGLVARMFILLLALLIILKFLNIDQDGFILSFFIFYFSQLAVEIGYFSRYKKIKAK